MTQTVFVVAPHMDDEVLGVGGSIARHVAEGDSVEVCVLANRAYGNEYHDKLIEEEKEAAREARDLLGYDELHFLDLPDEQLDSKLIEVIKPLETVYEKVDPDVVYTCHRGDPHQDHRAAFHASLVPTRAVSESPPDRVLVYEVPSSTDQAPPFLEYRFAPNVYVDIAEHVETKVEAMCRYERESREFPHPRSPEGIRTYAKKRGMEVGYEAAEAFELLRARR